jgi:hypothetical protein
MEACDVDELHDAPPTDASGVFERATFGATRTRRAFRAWLSSLAHDSEAAVAAALAYESMDDGARDAFLDALAEDCAVLEVPAVALYAPLLSVELDAVRRQRIAARLGDHAAALRTESDVTVLRAALPGGRVAYALVSPLYLDFVSLVLCEVEPGRGFVRAVRDPIRKRHQCMPSVLSAWVEPATSAKRGEATGCPAQWEEIPLRLGVEDLAHAIVAHVRERGRPPPALASLAHLFGCDLPAESEPHPWEFPGESG